MMRLILILAFLFPALALADESKSDDMHVTVKPKLCITDKRNPSCDLSFIVTWSSGETGYYCLFSDFSEAPARCWSEKNTGRHADNRNVQESFSYWMTGSDNDSRLAEVTIEVLRTDTDDRRRKRRTRHVWDIN